MNAYALGATIGSFIIPALVFLIGLKSAKRIGAIRIAFSWALAMFLIYASTIPAGNGFVAGLTFGHLAAIALGAWLTWRALTRKLSEPSLQDAGQVPNP